METLLLAITGLNLFSTFLNAFILDAYNSNDLFGISLKKIQNATPKISKRN